MKKKTKSNHYSVCGRGYVRMPIKLQEDLKKQIQSAVDHWIAINIHGGKNFDLADKILQITGGGK